MSRILPEHYYSKRLEVADGVYATFVFIDSSPCVSACECVAVWRWGWCHCVLGVGADLGPLVPLVLVWRHADRSSNPVGYDPCGSEYPTCAGGPDTSAFLQRARVGIPLTHC